MAIVIVMCILSALSIIIAILFVCSMKKKHKIRRDILLDRYSSRDYPDKDISGFEYYLGREKNYINNYITFQIVGKLCEILSIIFSVSSFALNYVCGKSAFLRYGKTVIPLMSVVLIIVVIYVVPSRRWAEYMDAWRKMDYGINEVIEGNMKLDELPKLLDEIENSITSDKV